MRVGAVPEVAVPERPPEMRCRHADRPARILRNRRIVEDDRTILGGAGVLDLDAEPTGAVSVLPCKQPDVLQGEFRSSRS
jgi:hypothetical protein